MTETIKAGTVLIRDDTKFPDTLRLETKPISPGWKIVQGLDGSSLNRQTNEAGWKFFYLAGERRATAFGREGQETLRRAVEQVLAGMKSEKCNAVEITRIEFKRFLGLPYVSVSFHLRNMQKGMFLLVPESAPAPPLETRLAAD